MSINNIDTEAPDVPVSELKIHPMYMKTNLTTVSFQIKNTVIYVSGYIMSGVSDYFSSLIEEFEGEHIQLNENVDEFVTFLNTFHQMKQCDRIKINNKNLPHVLHLSNKYGALDIYDNCISYILDNINHISTPFKLVDTIYSYGDNKNTERIIKSHIKTWRHPITIRECLLKLTPTVSKMYHDYHYKSSIMLVCNIRHILHSICYSGPWNTNKVSESLNDIPNTTPEQEIVIKRIITNIKRMINIIKNINILE